MQDLYLHNINIIDLRGHIRVTQDKKVTIRKIVKGGTGSMG